tara:strand:- start:1140 stop:1625 length:486 start_codon:yes stop_codon:yes gene_type:complete
MIRFLKVSEKIKVVVYLVFFGATFVGCTKHEEYSLPPKLGEKGNGVIIQGITIDYYTRKPVKASVTLLNVYSGIMQIIPKVTELRQDSSNAEGEFLFENVVFVGEPDKIVTDIGASTGVNQQGFSSGIVTMEYDGVVSTDFDIKEIFNTPQEVYTFIIVIG